ncbi:hypothetical protein ACFJIW_10715 [Tahibacter sp. UC22_41]
MDIFDTDAAGLQRVDGDAKTGALPLGAECQSKHNADGTERK